MSDREASNYSIQPRYSYPQSPPMGALAAADSYSPSDWPAGPAELPDIGAPLLSPGPQVSAGQPWANRLADTLTTPPPASTDNTVLYKTANPNVNFTQADIDRGFGLGMSFSGGGLGIKAYHGSPHDFDRFDLTKIGTGEGAQAYGHGLYFAENEGVAKSYKAAGQPSYLGADRIKAAQDLLAEAGGDRIAAMNLADARMKGTTKYDEGKMWQDVINNFDDLVGKTPGRMYEVNINADPAHFLDWDKPLSGQPTAVEDALFMRLLDKMPRRQAAEEMDVLQRKTGDQLYRNLSLNPREATQALANEGIPGIKYLDQGSRGQGRLPWQSDLPQGWSYFKTGDGVGIKDARGLIQTDVGQTEAEAHRHLFGPRPTSNYVVFNDKLIDIMRKYGLAGAAPAGMGALAAQDNYPPQ